MRIAAFSDLHLGFGDGADRFGHDLDAFSRFLDDLEARHDLIVVVGDLFETWQARRYGGTRAAVDEIRRTYPALVRRLTGRSYRLVSGNHDPILESEEHGVRHLEIASHGRRLLFTHGHQWDPPLKRTRPLAYSFAWSTGALNRMDGPVVQRVKRARDAFERRFLYNRPVPAALDDQADASCPYLQGATRLLADRRDLDVVVCGHTHVPARCETDHGTYLGCGAIAGGHLSWAELDTAEGNWLLRRAPRTTTDKGLGL